LVGVEVFLVLDLPLAGLRLRLTLRLLLVLRLRLEVLFLGLALVFFLPRLGEGDAFLFLPRGFSDSDSAADSDSTADDSASDSEVVVVFEDFFLVLLFFLCTFFGVLGAAKKSTSASTSSSFGAPASRRKSLEAARMSFIFHAVNREWNRSLPSFLPLAGRPLNLKIFFLVSWVWSVGEKKISQEIRDTTKKKIIYLARAVIQELMHFLYHSVIAIMFANGFRNRCNVA